MFGSPSCSNGYDSRRFDRRAACRIVRSRFYIFYSPDPVSFGAANVGPAP